MKSLKGLIKYAVFGAIFCAITFSKQTSMACEFASEDLKEQYLKNVGGDTFYDWVVTDKDSYELTEEEFTSIISKDIFKDPDVFVGKKLTLGDDVCVGTMAIPAGETKTINWSSKKFETGLPGYKWSWSLTVKLKANSNGNGYSFDSATYSVSTHTSFLELLAMQYVSYSCRKTSDSCTHSVSAKKVDFNVSVNYDISYLLQGQSWPTSYSVPGKDSHEVQLTK